MAAAGASLGICTEAPLNSHFSIALTPQSAQFQCENQAMNSLTPFTFRRSLIALTLWSSLSGSMAQEANILGLPAIPQPKPGSAAANAAQAASAAKPAAPAAPNRDVLAGELGIQHSALNGIGRLVFTTRTTFSTPGAQSSAIEAARAVQRDLAIACAKQCKPVKMGAPKSLAGGQLEFDVAFTPLYQHLNQAQFLAALQSKPLNLTPAQLNAPAIQSSNPTPAGTSSN